MCIRDRYTGRLCKCGTQTQNSYQTILAELGPADHIPPTITMTAPTQGATVDEGFTITVTPADENRIDRVQFDIDGTVFGTLEQPPWAIAAALVPPGTHTVT